MILTLDIEIAHGDAMAHDLFVEEGDYFAFCHVDEKNDGTWMA